MFGQIVIFIIAFIFLGLVQGVEADYNSCKDTKCAEVCNPKAKTYDECGACLTECSSVNKHSPASFQESHVQSDDENLNSK